MSPSNEPKDSGPLELSQLSDDELQVILQIESRLYEARESAAESKTEPDRFSYLAPADVRHPRVLLLDGDRGTGKTSLLLTLVHRWTPRKNTAVKAHDEDEDQYKHRVNRIKEKMKDRESLNKNFGTIPTHVKVVGRILDFDPLPPSMPLIAGIVQAWKPLVEKFDELSERRLDCEDEGETLTEAWYRLFQVAAVGWAAIPQSQSLIEQVLDRQEQLSDWHCLDRRWHEFIDKVLSTCIKEECHRLSPKPIFVIMIDDVDLQVGRIRELLPTLRTLYHPNVFFLIAADLDHVSDMLEVDFYGQQHKLAQHTPSVDKPLKALTRNNPWAPQLAHASIEKVFPQRNRWKIERLSLKKFLGFSGPDPADPTFLEILRSVKKRHEGEGAKNQEEDASPDKVRAEGAVPDGGSTDSENVGDAIENFAEKAEKLMTLPGGMTYRTAVQLWQNTEKMNEETRALRVLAQLLSGDLNDHEAVLDNGIVRVPVAGEIAAVHQPEIAITLGTHSIVLSARPDFVFINQGNGSEPIRMSVSPTQFHFVSALLAKLLEERKFPINASALRWETYLSHAWTEWILAARLSFAWPRFKHPKPDQLFEQARDWLEFSMEMSIFQEEDDEDLENDRMASERLDLWCYAWVFHQLRWSDRQWKRAGEGSNASRDREELDPVSFKADPSALPWDSLLSLNGLPDEKIDRWRKEMLPLMARPELGFSPKVQRRLLQASEIDDKSSLRSLRRRYVTDARFAAEIQQGSVLREFPSESEVRGWISKIDENYQKTHGENPWEEMVEEEAVEEEAP